MTSRKKIQSTSKSILEVEMSAYISSRNPIIPFRVDSVTKISGKLISVSSLTQAIIILDEVARLNKFGAIVGITFSANQEQTNTIFATYASNQWKTNISGTNQSAVINSIEQLLETPKYQHLQAAFKIIPITTMKFENNKVLPADENSIIDCLNNANFFKGNGGALLGWRNQETAAGQLALGDMQSSTVQPSVQKNLINKWVKDNWDKSLIITNNYVHKSATLAAGRSHSFFASVPIKNLDSVNKRYHQLSGDNLKTEILNDFRNIIENEQITTNEQLQQFKNKLMNTPEFEILKTGQDRFTRWMSWTGIIKTSSVKAFDDMFEQKKNILCNNITL